MKKKREYYRTAALLGAQPRRTYARAQPRPVHIPWRLVAVLVVVVGVAMWLWLDDRWYLMGEDLQVVGTSSTETARQAALASDLLGWHGLLLHPEMAKTLIVEQVAGVVDADVTCTRFPATCVIQLLERTPVLVWVTESGSYWVDQEGVPFPAQGDRPDLPQVQGPLPEAEKSHALAPVLQGVEALKALGVPADGLEYNLRRGLIWTDPEGRRVAFGTGPEMEPRWLIYQALVAHLEAKGIFPWAIDVRFPEGPTYSLERSW